MRPMLQMGKSRHRSQVGRVTELEFNLAAKPKLKPGPPAGSAATPGMELEFLVEAGPGLRLLKLPHWWAAQDDLCPSLSWRAEIS